ncbi:DUF4381 domain-containing protein [Legionella sp. km772]|uniref:DUF4381 domain-containing protein n=1 Tax=Legionella sp. km772 TaxID=2498111 RepID=UPI000F8D2060|nr:DUF4381 domain-containing protein [Legionella sp. km772]RUR13837.1 DUF4381 domain-containing protein [Legionella sp. km772]
MAEVDALAQLKDIHLPTSVGIWPLAPGWYVLIIVFFILMAGLSFVAYRRYLNARAKKQALVLLQSYVQQYEQDRNSQLASARISELLKRVALVYFPRQQVASIHGQEWINFLNATSKGLDFEAVKTMLLDSPFKPNEQIDLKPLISQATLWIKQRRELCLN